MCCWVDEREAAELGALAEVLLPKSDVAWLELEYSPLETWDVDILETLPKPGGAPDPVLC